MQHCHCQCLDNLTTADGPIDHKRCLAMLMITQSSFTVACHQCHSVSYAKCADIIEDI